MLPVTFTATLEKSPEKGGWTYVVWPESAAFFGTHGLVKVHGTADNEPIETSFMALGNGQHKLPIKASVLEKINKQPGDSVTIVITERL